MGFNTQQRWIVWIIIVAYLVSGISYALATPPLESSDEFKHYPFVQFVQTRQQLPVLDPQDPGLWLQEGAQPPLYYLLMAGVTAGIDTADLPIVHHKNPQAFIGNPSQVGNKNLIIHDPELESFPWRGSVLAIYVIRFVSLLMGVGTIVITLYLGKFLFDSRIALLAAGLTAFNPMFLFVSTAVNNDSLAILLGNLGLLLLVIIWTEKPAPQSAWWRYLMLGAVLGLGILTKLSLGGLIGLTGLTLAWISWREKEWRYLFFGGLLVILPILILSGWWFARNWQLYGDLTGLSPFIAVQGIRDAPLAIAGWMDEFGTFYRSFWGLFGGVNIAAPNWLYFFLNALTLIAFAGLLKWIWSKENRKRFVDTGIWLLAAWIMILLGLLVRWNMISPAFQGRLIFPALAAINVLWAVGFLSWFNERWVSRTAAALGGLSFLIAFFLPFLVIRPVYAAPEPLASVPQEAQIEAVSFETEDGQLQLVGSFMEAGQSVFPGGDPVVVTLYWQALSSVSGDYISSLHLLGRGLESVGQIDRYPAMGLIPTSRWQAGEIYRDEYHIYPNKDAPAPSQLRVAVGLFDDRSDQTLPAVDASGIPINLLIVGSPARLAAREPSIPELDWESGAEFEQGITLAGVKDLAGAPGEVLPLTLYWQADRIIDLDYTVFVHLLDENGEQIAEADAPPVGNDYPTSLWQEGDVIDDTHYLELAADLKPGDYQVNVGLYDPSNGMRVPRLDEPGDHVEFFIRVER